MLFFFNTCKRGRGRKEAGRQGQGAQGGGRACARFGLVSRRCRVASSRRVLGSAGGRVVWGAGDRKSGV